MTDQPAPAAADHFDYLEPVKVTPERLDAEDVNGADLVYCTGPCCDPAAIEQALAEMREIIRTARQNRTDRSHD